jgi:hypothetical protein
MFPNGILRPIEPAARLKQEHDMKNSIFAAAAIALCSMAGASQAATMSGTFDVRAVNITNVNSTQSQATMANFNNALLSGVSDVFTYIGSLNFSTNAGGATTVASWLATGVANSVGGSVVGLDSALSTKQLSKGNINNGTATTTFFLFTAKSYVGAADFSVRHDDGIAVYDDNARIGGFLGPNSVRTTEVDGFDGGKFSILYVATNSDPSILKVDATLAPVPLPAALPLLAAGLGGLAMLRRRRKAA